VTLCDLSGRSLSERLRGVFGEAERCCAVVCDYRPEAVKVYLSIVLAFEAAEEDPCQQSRTRLRTGGGTAGDGLLRLWDVQQAIKALRTEGHAVTAVAVARRLCPWSVPGWADLDSDADQRA
jgi:hypothetical protein